MEHYFVESDFTTPFQIELTTLTFCFNFKTWLQVITLSRGVNLKYYWEKA